MRSRTGAAVLTLVLTAALLAGCVPSAAPVIPTATPTATPVFASEAEALAAAEAAYKAFVAASDDVTKAGGKNSGAAIALVAPRYRPNFLASLKPYIENELHTRGASSFDSLRLERYSTDSSPEMIQVYVCLDVSKVRVLDKKGRDVTSSSRANRLPLEVGFDVSPQLLISRSDVWSGENFCAS
jgi:hypothetical protein